MIDFKSLTDCVGSNFNVNTSNEKFLFSDIKFFMVTQETPLVFYYRTSFAGELGTVNIIWESSSTRTSKVSCTEIKSKRSTRKPSSKAGQIKEDDVREKRLKILDEWDNKKAYSAPTGISLRKKTDLTSLLNSGVVPETYRDYYEKLPIFINKKNKTETNPEKRKKLQ